MEHSLRELANKDEVHLMLGIVVKATSFWSEGDIVVEELSELHRHVGETLRAQLCITVRLVHCI